MKAAVIHATGGPEVFKLVNDHPKPTRGPGQVSWKALAGWKAAVAAAEAPRSTYAVRRCFSCVVCVAHIAGAGTHHQFLSQPS